MGLYAGPIGKRFRPSSFTS